MSQPINNEVSPGDLLKSFNGRSLKSIIVFTVVAHAVLLLATSGGYIWRSVTGATSANLGEKERMDIAVKEAAAAMRRIAEQHGLKPQDLGSNFAAPGPGSKAVPPQTGSSAEPSAAVKNEPVSAPPPSREESKSTMEKELEKAVPGPAVPTDEDLFK